jgi:thiol-disulfide isomerase/thioredoxin
MKKSSFILLFCCVSVSAISQKLNPDSLYEAMVASQKALVGTSFSFADLVTLKGERITNSSLNKKVVVYNLWFTSCSPCVAEMPALNKLKDSYGSNVVFIGITFEPADHVKDFLKEHPFDFKIVTMAKTQLEEKVSFGYPTTIIVNKKGKIAYVGTGGPTDHEKAENAINTSLKPAIDKALLE